MKSHSNTLLLSIPKSGRTWLRMMLDKCEHTVNQYNKSHNHKQIDQFGKIVYLHRDPIDVAVSSYYHLQSKPNEAHDIPGADSNTIRLELYDYVEATLNDIIDYNRQLLQLIENKNKLIVTYEDLKLNGPETLKSIIEFISDKEISQDLATDIYNKFDFTNMKRIANNNHKAIIKYSLNDKVRKGKIKGYREEFNQEQIKKLEDLYGARILD